MQASQPLPLTMAYATTAVCSAAAALYAALATEPAPLVGLTIAFGPLVAVLLWLHEDARRTKAVDVQDWGFFLCIAWPALLPWYAVKTRGRRGSYRVLFPVLLVVSLSACESPLSPSEILALRDAEARWAHRTFQDYAFEIRRSCFCEPSVTQWARVEVLGGVVSRVVLVDTGAEVSPQERSGFPTVEGVFASIRDATQYEWLDDIKVEFDPVLGYPTQIALDPKPNILDAGSTTYLRSVTPMPLLHLVLVGKRVRDASSTHRNLR